MAPQISCRPAEAWGQAPSILSFLVLAAGYCDAGIRATSQSHNRCAVDCDIMLRVTGLVIPWASNSCSLPPHAGLCFVHTDMTLQGAKGLSLDAESSVVSARKTRPTATKVLVRPAWSKLFTQGLGPMYNAKRLLVYMHTVSMTGFDYPRRRNCRPTAATRT